jgi:hypothetical protein
VSRALWFDRKELVSPTRSEQNTLDAAQRQVPDSVERREIVRRVVEARAVIIKELGAIADKVAKKSLTVTEAEEQARLVLIAETAVCAGLGAQCAGLGPEWTLLDSQIDDLTALIEGDIKYFVKFMRSIEAMKREDRVRMYGGAADDAFYRGFASSLPSSAVIHWRLGVAEHCEDCLHLAAISPYSKPGGGRNPLPTVPRNGDTECLTNCRCHLEVSAPFETGPFSPIRVEVIGIGPLTVPAMSPGAMAAAVLYQETIERYAYYRRLDAIDPKGGWDAIARDMLREIERMARANGHRVRLAQTDEEIIAPVLLAKAMGMRHVTKIDDELLQFTATVIAISETDAGKVTATTKSPPTVTIGENTYRIDAVGRAILFVE